MRNEALATTMVQTTVTPRRPLPKWRLSGRRDTNLFPSRLSKEKDQGNHLLRLLVIKLKYTVQRQQSERYMTHNEKVLEIGKVKGGYILREDVVEAKIPTVVLSRLIKGGEIERCAPGIYLLKGYPIDDFFEISARYKGAYFCRRSALYLHDLTNRQIEKLEVNLPPHSNISSLKGIICHYPGKKVYEMGQCKLLSPSGREVNGYNLERCLCDLYYYDDFDMEEKAFIFAKVDKEKIDYDKMFRYASELGVLREIQAIFEVYP